MSIEVIVGILVTFALPWMTWVSKTLWTINQHTIGLVERTKDNERRIIELEALLPRHIPHT